MPKIDIENVSESTGGEYPARFRHVDAACTRQALGDAVGLNQYGVNLTRIPRPAQLRHCVIGTNTRTSLFTLSRVN